MTKNKKSVDKNMFSDTRQNYYTFVPNLFFFFWGEGSNCTFLGKNPSSLFNHYKRMT